MAEYVWVTVYRENSGYMPFFVHVLRNDATIAGAGAGTDFIRTDRYRIDTINGERRMVYDPEPKYEQRDCDLVNAIRDGIGSSSFSMSFAAAAELVAKHRQAGASR